MDEKSAWFYRTIVTNDEQTPGVQVKTQYRPKSRAENIYK